MKSTINHADLLRLSDALGHSVDVDLAALMGFESSQPLDDRSPLKPPGKQQSGRTQTGSDQPLDHRSSEEVTPQQVHFSYAYLAIDEQLPEAITPVLIKQDQSKKRTPRPTVPPLISQSEALHHLQQTLQMRKASRSIDLPEVVKTIAQNKALEHLPFKQQMHLPDTLCLLLDVSARLEPAVLELQQYLQAAQHLFGHSRLQYCPINYPPNANGDFIFTDGSCLNDHLQENTAVLYIGDQGAFSRTALRDAAHWSAFWQQLQQSRIQSSWINLAAPDQADPGRVKQLMAATMRCEGPQFDRIRHMHIALMAASQSERHSPGKFLAEQLLVWNHPDHSSPGQIADVDIPLLHKWSRVYQQIPRQQRQAVEKSFKQWRQSIVEDTAAMEQLKGASLNLEAIENPQALDKVFSARQASSMYPAYISSRKALLKHIIAAIKNNLSLKKATQSLTKAVYEDPSADSERVKAEIVRIKQQGDKLKYIFGEGASRKMIAPQATLNSPVLDANGRTLTQSGTLDLNQVSLHFESDTHYQEFRLTTRPDWAERIWHNASGLYAAHTEGTEFKLQPATNREQNPTWQGTHNAWDWATDYGIDNYGLWAILSVKTVDFRLRWIPTGTFLMGSPAEEKGRNKGELQHKVTLTKGYWLAETSVTQAQWQVVMGKNPSDPKELELPVNQVNWDDCQAFIQKLKQFVSGFNPRLPTEAQWEYACRAGTITAYWWGDKFEKSKANKEFLMMQETKLPQNPFGLRSMSGNVYEWCNDRMGDYPPKAIENPQGAEQGSRRVLRGGCCFNSARVLRSANRDAGSPGLRDHDVGLRLAGGSTAQASTSDDTLTADRRAEQTPVRRQSSIAEKVKEFFKQ